MQIDTTPTAEQSQDGVPYIRILVNQLSDGDFNVFNKNTSLGYSKRKQFV